VARSGGNHGLSKSDAKVSVTPTSLPPCDPRQNQLLAALAEADLDAWRPQLEPVDLRAGQVLFEAGATPAHLYFPTTAVVSLTYTTLDGASAEVAVVGHDGAVGISTLMGGSTTPGRSVVQSAGRAYRLGAQAVQGEAARAGPLLHMLLRYTQVMIMQVAQTAMCNRYHLIDQQLARRLLVALDRSASDDLAMTQEGVAGLLGVRREGVTAAALKLQLAGAIRYRRGHIEVLDRELLQRHACECYAVVKREHDRLLPAPLADRRGRFFGIVLDGLVAASPPSASTGVAHMPDIGGAPGRNPRDRAAPPSRTPARTLYKA
jgi:CRP-like cAMP-binding protein